MELELFQIIILILAGCMTGISMSFIGQTGAGVVIPIVVLITGDPLLALSINILNDLIAVVVVSFSYIKRKNIHFNKDYLYFLFISIITSIVCIILLMLTELGNAVSWILPIVFIVLGAFILKNGFPTAKTIRDIVHNIIEKLFKNRKTEEEIKKLEEEMDEQICEESNEIIEGLIPIKSRLYYFAMIIIGVVLGVNSGLFGSAGGVIIAILLILFGYPLKKAVGTGLILSIFICLSTLISFQIIGFIFKNKLYFDLTITLYLSIGTILMGFITSNLVQNMSAMAMGRTMGVIMVLLGIITLMMFFIS